MNVTVPPRNEVPSTVVGAITSAMGYALTWVWGGDMRDEFNWWVALPAVWFVFLLVVMWFLARRPPPTVRRRPRITPLNEYRPVMRYVGCTRMPRCLCSDDDMPCDGCPSMVKAP